MRVMNYKIFDPIKDEWMERIKVLKPIIGKTFEDPDHSKMMMCGSRWGDYDRIFKNAISFASDDEKGFGIPPEEALEKIKTLDQQEIDEFIIKGLKDAAGGDYWYRYEKDWG